MSTIRLSDRATCEKSTALRLLVGLPVLCAAMVLCIWVAWARSGFSLALAPRHWWDLGIIPLLGMVFWGGLTIVLGIGALWIFGIVAGAFGEGFMAAWRRLRHGKAPSAKCS